MASKLLSALLLNRQHVMVGQPYSSQKRISRIHCSLPEHCAPFHSHCCLLWQKYPTSTKFQVYLMQKYNLFQKISSYAII